LKVGVTFHEKFCQYDLGHGHPFRGDRFRNAKNFFEEQGLFRLPYVTVLRPEPATKRDLLRVHDKSYVNLIFRLAEEGKPYDIETPVSPQILEAALLIVGGGITAGMEVCEGRLNRAVSLGGGFHHAGRNYGGGFCLFNDVAVTVQYVRERFGLKRVLILDYDVHFGNGTSDIFYSDPNVLFVSVHQDPRTLYPGTGFVEDVGKGAGEGYNVNVPLPPGTGDETYLYAVKEILVPLSEEFEPEIIVGNGGSDPHFADSLGNLMLTTKGFFRLSRLLVEVADKLCGGKLILMVGSGYNPAVLPACWYSLVAGVAGLEAVNVGEPYTPPIESPHCRRTVQKTLEELKHILSRYWRCFR